MVADFGVLGSMQAKDIRKMFWSSGSPIANLFRFPANFANGVPAVPFGQDTMEDKNHGMLRTEKRPNRPEDG